AEALATAHAARIVHRDVKPGNIIVTAPGRMKILDFGLASYLVGNATGLDPPVDPSNDETGAHPVAVDGFAGTVAYASPEQSLRRPVDHRSDIFSLAVVLHEMLTGERP